MSGIEDLKQGVEIGNDDRERVNMMNLSEPHSRTKKTEMREGMAEPKSNSINIDTSSRIEADLTGMPRGDENQPGVELKESLTKDILEGENSMFAKYKVEKIKEMEERMAQFEQEQELEEDETENEEDLVTGSLIENSSSNGVDLVSTDINYAVDIEDVSNLPNIADTGVLNIMTTEAGPEPLNVIEVQTEPIKEEKVENPDIDLDIKSTDAGLEGIEFENEEDVQEQDSNEILKHLQKLVTEKLKPVSKSLDLSSYTVLKKPSANTKILQQQQVKVAKWVLPNQESVVLMKEYLGSELEALREFSEDNTSFSQLSRKYRSIYDHIVSPKPSTYEAWAKSTPFSDIDHYFFAVYISAFKGANFLPADCPDPKCKETFLTNDIAVMDMVKFSDEKAKEKFLDLYKSESMPTGKGLYCTEMIPLSNTVAIGFKEPSVYSLFEIASLDQKFKEKYSSIIEYIPYIDSVYIIDNDNKQIIPVGYKVYPDNAIKTVKSKIQQFNKALKSLNIDEFGAIKAFMRAINTREVGMTYQYPEIICPKCGKQIEAKSATAEELVFTRYQLGALVNTSLK